MIARLEGELVELRPEAALVRVGALTYRLLIPACDFDRLQPRIGTTIEFHTSLDLEAHGQGNTFVPRLIGFSSESDRRFFELFTSVKGIGPRKALRAFAVAPSVIAAAIAGRDVILLKSLPEIGARTAETIVAQLSGKVERFVEDMTATSGAASSSSSVEGKPGGGAAASSTSSSPRHIAARDALAALVALGEPRPQASQWIDQILRDEPELRDAESMVAAVYHRRGAAPTRASGS